MLLSNEATPECRMVLSSKAVPTETVNSVLTDEIDEQTVPHLVGKRLRTTKSVVKTEEIIKRVEKEKGKINKIQPDEM